MIISMNILIVFIAITPFKNNAKNVKKPIIITLPNLVQLQNILRVLLIFYQYNNLKTFKSYKSKGLTTLWFWNASNEKYIIEIEITQWNVLSGYFVNGKDMLLPMQ